jgi:hypothetical protein
MIDASANIDIDNAFVSIDSDDLRTPALPPWKEVRPCERPEDVASEASNEGTLAIAHIQLSDRSSQPSFARAIARRERPISSWLWSDAFYSNVTNSTSVDWAFETKILQAVSNVAPQGPLWKAKGGREYGRITPRSRARPLCDAEPQACRRRDHVAMHGRSVPEILRDSSPTSFQLSPFEVPTIFHEAIRAELRSLHRILSSLETRMLDITSDDVQSFFAWIGPLGDFVRLYFASSERFLMGEIEAIADVQLREGMLPNRRKSSRLGIVKTFEGIERLKRPMQVHIESCAEFIPKLVELSDKLTTRILNHLDAETEQVPALLSSHFLPAQKAEVLGNMMHRMQQCSAGAVLMGILATGAGKNPGHQRDWLVQHQDVSMFKKLTGRWSARSADRWIRQCDSAHKSHAVGFLEAEAEYREFYF